MSSIIVVSHRRSGTHLTIDSILNNFSAFTDSPTVSELTLDNYTEKKLNHDTSSIQELARLGRRGEYVYKTHSNINVERYFGSSYNVESNFLEDLISTSKIIYVYRDGRDVMTSLYHYQKSFSPVVQKQSFSEFLGSTNTTDSYSYDGSFSKVGYWAFHVSKWLSRENVLSLSFDELKNDSNSVINKIANHVGLEPNKKVIDVGMEKADDGSKVLDKSAKRSSVSFRKGVSGDWVNEFSESDLEYFHQEVDSVSAEINKRLYRI